MAMLNKVRVSVELDPIVKLTCYTGMCINNNIRSGLIGTHTCNLKNIDIDKDGKCMNLYLITEKDADSN